MTIVTPQPETSNIEYERSPSQTVNLSPHDPRFENWLLARKVFVDAMGWVTPDGEERDIYDDDSITAQLVTFGKNNEVLFGMRLTPVNKISNSLSWEMVKDSTIHEQIAEVAEKEREQLWDLTRLVPGPEVPVEGRSKIIIELLHHGLNYCQQEGDPDPVWIFALDKGFYAWLRRQGIEVELLAKAKIGNDTAETLFGLARPMNSAQPQYSPSALYNRLTDGETSSDS